MITAIYTWTPDYFGRRGAIFITALCLIATPIGSGFTKSWQGLFICRYVPLSREERKSSLMPSQNCNGTRYGCKGIHRTDFCCGECSDQHQRRTWYVPQCSQMTGVIDDSCITVMSWQLWTAFGIFLGFAANVIVIDTGSIAWRLQLGSAFIPVSRREFADSLSDTVHRLFHWRSESISAQYVSPRSISSLELMQRLK